ncbi:MULTISPECIES: hypothetical protein [Cellulomonas]|jgi:hypothetical protein|nr:MULTISPECIES: hypothetical protein [Cellulomonas]VTR77177.1 hypothetical protein CHMI_01947 [Cellulomonas hominis]
MSDQCCQFTLTDEDEMTDCCGGQEQCADHDKDATTSPAAETSESVA